LKFCTKYFNFSIFAMILLTTVGCLTSLPESNRVSPNEVNELVAIMPPNAVAMTSEVATVQAPLAVNTEEIAVSKSVPREHSKLRTLKSGDNVIIHLRSIPQPQEIKEVIDGWGEITMPYIGEVHIVGKTVSEAERLIESSYIDGGIYKKINAIVVAEAEVYFVRGEATRRGKYALSGAVTLLQAISEAGGFTPFANKRKIKVMRGDEIIFYNSKDIDNGKISDPPIFSDDIIEVMRRRW